MIIATLEAFAPHSELSVNQPRAVLVAYG